MDFSIRVRLDYTRVDAGTCSTCSHHGLQLHIPGRDPGLEKGQRFLMFQLKARSQFVVLREVEIDDFIGAVCS